MRLIYYYAMCLELVENIGTLKSNLFYDTLLLSVSLLGSFLTFNMPSFGYDVDLATQTFSTI